MVYGLTILVYAKPLPNIKPNAPFSQNPLST